VDLIFSKLLKKTPTLIKINYFLAELLIVEYRKQSNCVTNLALHK